MSRPNLAANMPHHHPGDDLLMDYAAGSIGEAEALIVAAHLTLCPACRRAVADYEALGGALIEEAEPEPLDMAAFADVLSLIDRPDAGVPPTPAAAASSDPRLPRPVASYLPAGLDRLDWKPVMRGLDEFEIEIKGRGSARAKLLRIKAGVAMPRHTHRGNEMTLVLCGAFDDEGGHYARGDMEVTDGAVDHRPVAAPGEDCICLTVVDAPLKLTGPIGRFLNPFIRF